MSNNSIHNAIRRISANIPGAFSYLFDVEDQRFLYQSSINEELEKEIIKLKQTKDIKSLLDDSNDNFCSISCDHMQRVLMVKRMASDIFFGMCVDQKPEIMAMAEKAMKGNLN